MPKVSHPREPEDVVKSKIEAVSHLFLTLAVAYGCAGMYDADVTEPERLEGEDLTLSHKG